MNTISFKDLELLPKMARSEEVIIKLNTSEHFIDLIHRYIEKDSHPNCNSWSRTKDLNFVFHDSIKRFKYDNCMYVLYKHGGLFHGFYLSDFKNQPPIYEYVYSDYEVELI